MKKCRYGVEQIIGILKEAEAGIKVDELSRKYGISDATYYNWKAKYGGMTVSDARRLRVLEEENRRLKQIVADQTLDIQALKSVISKNF
ncbi:MAG: Transposase [Elusimicrobia bacterium ADurb.Bin231]|nr:MAG: Transposase [Elusimicrobia bacterium ADurb.Bin231]